MSGWTSLSKRLGLLTKLQEERDGARHLCRFSGRMFEMLEWNGRAERPYSMSVSIGWARFDWRHPCSIEDLIARADHAMYRDKGLRD